MNKIFEDYFMKFTLKDLIDRAVKLGWFKEVKNKDGKLVGYKDLRKISFSVVPLELFEVYFIWNTFEDIELDILYSLEYKPKEEQK